MEYRAERDSMGAVKVPAQAYFGAQTVRAVANFPVSGRTVTPALISAIATIKRHAADANRRLGLLSPEIAEAVAAAAREVEEGRHADQFPVDVFQTGSGTSTNMNVNEVLAGRANEMLTGKRGGKSPVHPNDHVNRGQSSNDVIPSAIHVAAVRGIRGRLLPAVAGLHGALWAKAGEFAGIWKIGRTHLQDALPVTLGDEFSGYARQMALATGRLGAAEAGFLELALGGTATGRGDGAHPDFARLVIEALSRETGHAFREAENRFEAQGAQDAAVFASGALKAVAVSLAKIAGDIRLLGCGPRAGLGEIRLPELQPGSSIMPGKVNPVIPECVIQVAARVVGNDAAISWCGAGGQLELNAMMPVMAEALLESIELLAAVARVFEASCVRGVEADRAACAAKVERSLALATYLVPLVGYDRAAEVAREAAVAGETVREAAIRLDVATPEEVDRALSAFRRGGT